MVSSIYNSYPEWGDGFVDPDASFEERLIADGYLDASDLDDSDSSDISSEYSSEEESDLEPLFFAEVRVEDSIKLNSEYCSEDESGSEGKRISAIANHLGSSKLRVSVSPTEGYEVDSERENSLSPQIKELRRREPPHLTSDISNLGLSDLFDPKEDPWESAALEMSDLFNTVRWADYSLKPFREDMDFVEQEVVDLSLPDLNLNSMQKCFKKLFKPQIMCRWGQLAPTFGLGVIPPQLERFHFNRINLLFEGYFRDFVVGLTQSKEDKRGKMQGPTAEDFQKMLGEEKDLVGKQKWFAEQFSNYCRKSYRRKYSIDLLSFRTWIETKKLEWEKCPGFEYNHPIELGKLYNEMSQGLWKEGDEREIELCSITDATYFLIAKKIFPAIFSNNMFTPVLELYLVNHSPITQTEQ